MYQFKIKKQDDGVYRFELGGIKMLIDDYIIKGDKHLLANPRKAIAFFSYEDNIYGVSNEPGNFDSAEAFYDAMNKQYLIMNSDRKAQNNAL
jgi:hypothetical protein